MLNSLPDFFYPMCEAFKVLDIINTVILYFIGVPFFLQLLYMLLFWIKKKEFKKSKNLNRIAVVIPAHNESDVIYETVHELFTKQKYPKDLFDVYVIADNCTDNTKELAESAGAKVFVHTDDDPKHHIVGYALKYGFEELLKVGIKYDFIIRLDADNHINDTFFRLMNDAYNEGVKIARPYESAINMVQSPFTKACGLYYIFDSRFSSRARERLHIDAHVNGPGSMTAYEIIEKLGGYDTVTMCEDTEFNIKRMCEGYRCHFVEDAVVYEDLPSTMRDTLARNKRLGAGNTRMLFKMTPKLFYHTFKNKNFSFIEQFLTYLFIPICPILCIWLPCFYIFAYVWKIIVANSGWGATNFFVNGAGIVTSYAADAQAWISNTTMLICTMVGVLFLFCGILQGAMLVWYDYKKMGAESRKQLISGVLLFPIFSVVYIITITIGIFSKPKWTKVRRNPNALKKS